MKRKRNLDFRPNEWDKAFISERNNLLFLLPQFKINVEHIGATSVNGCRSFRNVDIMISVHDFIDLQTIAMLLESKEYRLIKELSSMDVLVLVKKKKVNKVAVTVRVVQYASNFYNRAKAFKVLLQENYQRVEKYNKYRDELIQKVGYDIAKYNEIKYNYINSLIDENFKFEEKCAE